MSDSQNCDCKQLIKNYKNRPNKCFLGNVIVPYKGWIEHCRVRMGSKHKFYRLFFKQDYTLDYGNFFIWNDNFSEMLFYVDSNRIGSSLIQVPYLFNQDLYCEHDALFLTINQFNDLQEIIAHYKMDAIIKYLTNIGFYYV